MLVARRRFLFLAPAIIAAPSLMRVSGLNVARKRIEFEGCLFVNDGIDFKSDVIGCPPLQRGVLGSNGWGFELRRG